MVMDKKTTEGVKRFLDDCPEGEGLEPGEKLSVRWSRPGVGFGGFYIFEEDGKVMIESESMSKKFIKEVLCSMVDKAEVVD